MTMDQPRVTELKPPKNHEDLLQPPFNPPRHHKAIDITNETCPMTFVRTRLALDAMQSGEVLLVRLKGEESITNVPRAAADQGHDPLDLLIQPDGIAILVLRKG